MSDLVNCMIVDDEPLAVQLIEQHISQVPELKLVATANNPLDAIQKLKDESIDLLFLDIQMPILTGVELVKTLKNPPGIIFTTAYREYAVESYELDVVDYLLKPITFMRFLKAVNKYINREVPVEIGKQATKDNNDEPSIYVNVNKKFIKVNYVDICFVESVKDYIHIHTIENTIITKDKIGEFELKLPNDFIRIHRSFIVNKKRVSAFTSQDVEVSIAQSKIKEVPIGASYKDKVKMILKPN